MQEHTNRSALAIDPITLEVIRHGLVSITNQIDANIKRTAFSPYIYEYNDFAVGLTDAGYCVVPSSLTTSRQSREVCRTLTLSTEVRRLRRSRASSKP